MIRAENLLLCLFAFAVTACWRTGPLMAAPHVFGDPSVLRRPPERTYHVYNYKLTLHFEQQKGEIFGDELITLQPLGPGLQRLYLDSSELSIESVTLRGAGNRRSPLHFASGRSRLWITLDRAHDRSDTLRLEIRYHGFPRAGLYFVNPSAAHPNSPREIWTQGEAEFNHFWFPCWDYPNDMATSETIVTVPSGESVVSNGRLAAVTRQGHRVTYDWVESIPHSSYLISLAIGPWRKVSDHYGRLPVDYYVLDTVTPARARRSLHLTPDMIGFFSRALGVPYPYEKYAQVAVSSYFFGGQENVSATTLTATTLHDARADPDYSSEALVAHELGQQWFGDFVQGRDWADIWLNEGFATYLEALYPQYHEGNDAFRLKMMQYQELAQRQDQEDYVRPIVDAHYGEPMQMFDSITHEKAAVVLDMLRDMLDGDAAEARAASQRELFFRALHDYLTRYRAQAVDTAALIETLETATGRKLDWFFREWVYMAGYPKYRVTARYDATARNEELVVTQTQEGAGVPRVFRMPLEVEFHGADGQSHRVVINDRERMQRFDVRLAFKPLWVDFDPHAIVEKSLVLQQSAAALAAKAQRDPAMMSRLAAVRELGDVRGPEAEAAVEALTKALGGDAFYGVRVYAALSLGRLHTQSARSALMAALDQPDSRVRAAVIEALADFHGDADAYQAFVRRLDGDPSYAVRAAAARAVGASGAADALAVLEQAAAKRSDSHVMDGVFAGLAATGDPRAISILLTGARPGIPLDPRLQALRALEQPSASGRLASIRSALVATVRAALADSDLSIRQAGEAVASAWGLTETRADIGRLAQTAPTAFERDSANRALQQLAR